MLSRREGACQAQDSCCAGQEKQVGNSTGVVCRRGTHPAMFYWGETWHRVSQQQAELPRAQYAPSSGVQLSPSAPSYALPWLNQEVRHFLCCLSSSLGCWISATARCRDSREPEL